MGHNAAGGAPHLNGSTIRCSGCGYPTDILFPVDASFVCLLVLSKEHGDYRMPPLTHAAHQVCRWCIRRDK